MTKDEFRKLFLAALENAALAAEKQTGGPISRSFAIELHAPGCPGLVVEVEEAFDRLYLGENLFYKVIDVAVVALTPEQTVAFVRVSGHPPVPLAQTWNAFELGPFKPMQATRIEVRHASEYGCRPLGVGTNRENMQMNDHDFIRAIGLAVRESAISGTMQTLASPPGRRPPADKLRRAEWFNALEEADRENIERVAADAVDSAIFGFLSVLDGVRAVENQKCKGGFELWHVRDDERVLLNQDADLHDKFQSERMAQPRQQL